MKLSDSGITTKGLAVDESDVVRGKYQVPDTGLYAAKIDMAWTYKSPGGSQQFMVNFVGTDSNWNVTQRYSLTNKKGENFSVRDGIQRALPGFSNADNLVKLLTGQSVTDIDFEPKMVPMYDFNAGEKVPKELQVAMGLVGKELQVALVKKIENKRKNVDGKWINGPDKKEFCEVDKAFDKEGRTLAEAKAGAEPVFKDRWLEANEGRVDDSYVPPATSGAPQPGAPAIPAAGAPTPPLFPQD